MEKDLYFQLQAAISQCEDKEELLKIAEFVKNLPDSELKEDLKEKINTEMQFMG